MRALIKTLCNIPAANLLLSCLAWLAVSCGFQGEFRDNQPGQSFALLTADKGPSFRDSGPAVFSINSHPTSFWRSEEKFRISPGETVLAVIADREPYEFGPLRFVAAGGRHYHLRYGPQRQSVVLYDVTNPQRPTRVVRSLGQVTPQQLRNETSRP